MLLSPEDRKGVIKIRMCIPRVGKKMVSVTFCHEERSWVNLAGSEVPPPPPPALCYGHIRTGTGCVSRHPQLETQCLISSSM